MTSQHGSVSKNKSLEDLLEIKMSKADKKPFTKKLGEGTYIANHDGIILNSMSEWNQPQIVRTKTTVIQVGADQQKGTWVKGQGEVDRPGPGRREAGSTENNFV